MRRGKQKTDILFIYLFLASRGHIVHLQLKRRKVALLPKLFFYI